ncbi:type II CAAX prenyl endopeptidase Rce1 family protein [Sandaracinus amylolyticus]|uniref:CPBP family glutamic-type intramembrane protease n=1 Tax=Sandaracinus amylolyticus TaxID=927083 RepID=UPI001F1E4739|nr:CPBP family glutamic-type intramembrane protease [Sandaracinus amylolyticus]
MSDADEGAGPSGSWLFHAALIAGVLPVLGVPIVALATAAAWRSSRGGDARERRWAKRLSGLLALDVVAALVVLATSLGMLPAPEQVLAPSDGPRIGVAVDDAYSGEGLRVAEVLEGSPADGAGIVGGDVLLRADGAPVESLEGLRSALGAGDGTVAIELRRGDAIERVEVVPVHGALGARERCGEVRAADLVPGLGTLVSYGVVLIGALVLAWLGWKRGVRGGARTVVPFALIPPLGALVGTGIAMLACRSGGEALVLEIALLGSEIVLVAMAAGAVWLASRGWEGATPTLDGDPPMPVPRVVALGVMYVATWVPRVLVLAMPLFAAARTLGVEGGSEALGEVLGGDRAPIALLMTFVAGALLAPLGEELLFRGLLVPWLARVVTPWSAIVISALLFGALHDAHGMARIGPMTIGLVLGWARLRSGTLIAPIAIHAIVNSIALTIGWLTS